MTPRHYALDRHADSDAVFVPARLRANDGFTLFALLAVLAVLAMGMGIMVVFADRVLEGDRTSTVTDELEDVYRAVLGDQRDTFGYIGDVGAFPNSLMDLVVNPGVPGWQGPYLRDPRVVNNLLRDPWGQPYEYWVIDGVPTSDRLAIISRGPDGLSTNTAADPNARSTFTGVTPPTANYFTSDPKNADNVVFPIPDPSLADTLNINTDSNLNLTLNSSQGGGTTSACANLFTVTVTNTTRETNEVPPTPYSSGFQVTLLQGTYRVLVHSGTLPVPLVNDRIVVLADVPLARTYNLPGIEGSGSGGTGTFQLTVTNKFPLDTVTVWSGTTKLGTVAANGGVKTFTVPGCVTITVTIVDDNDDEDSDSDSDDGGDGTGGILGKVVDTFTMPNSNFSRIVGATAAAVTIKNNLNVKVQVFANGLFIGDIKKKKTKTFSDDLVAGIVITVKRADNGALVKTFTLAAGSQMFSVP